MGQQLTRSDEFCMATVVLVGTLDTKGIEYSYVRERIQAAGCEVILIDVGVLGKPLCTPDITREEVAHEAQSNVDALVTSGQRGRVVDTMARGATEIVRKLYSSGRLHGLMGLGGSAGTSVATQVMQALPIGVPKLMVSTVASGNTVSYVGAVDITMMHSVLDIAGINRISEMILANAAGAIIGMAESFANFQPAMETRPLIAATMFGVTTPCVTAARKRLESIGYEVLVFHATGIGGRSMENLIREGVITGVLDITTTELADELVGGVMSAGPHRLEAAGAMGIPQVVSVGALNAVNFGPRNTVPQRFAGRTLGRGGAAITLMRTSPEECAMLGRIMAEKLNRATGPVSVFIPLRGFAMGTALGEKFYDPDADRTLIDSLKVTLRAGIDVYELDMDINNPEFAHAMADRLDDYIRQQISK